MTSPPRRPIISLKFKTPVAANGDLKPAAPAPKAAPMAPTTPSKAPAAPSRGPATPSRGPVPQPPPQPQPAPKAEAAKKNSPAISPDIFKAAIKAAGLAIQNVVNDPEWKSEELLHQYQAAKDCANSTHKQQAKLVSTVATRRHAKDIEQAGVESPAMRAAYAAALVTLVKMPDKHE